MARRAHSSCIFAFLKDAFAFFINVRHNKPAEMIAKFLDEKLRAGPKGCSDDDLDTLFDRVMVLFRFINGAIAG